ncbi:hypothetical protein CBS101457_004626 [Exobasidium rhododendri]|nr:hypothetical protein CBS101457_004626 [Exobasidium rhododendri]
MSIPQPVRDNVQETVEEGPTRYAAFAMRLRTVITASSRYVAYSSDIGEAFRPLTNPNFVRAAYAVSWTYILGDVGYAGYRAHSESVALREKGPESLSIAQKVELKKREAEAGKTVSGKVDAVPGSEMTHVGLVMARRAVFQSIASMALPAFTIHSIVRYSAPLFAKSSRPRIRSSGPTIAGLAFVPALPFLFDEPVEHVIDTAFDWIEARIAAAKTSEAKKLKTELVATSSPPSSTNLIAKAAIVGIGVDTIFLPRLVTLLTRHSKRLQVAATSSSTISPLALASQQLARRISHDWELSEWKTKFDDDNKGRKTISTKEISWLAARWTVKEAAFKAVPNHQFRLSWHDAYLTKVNNRPTLCHTPEVLRAWQEAGLGDSIPSLHVSITHDGDYLTAFVVAEQVKR